METQRACPASLVVFRFVEDEERVAAIVERAAEEGALVVFTASPKLSQAVQVACLHHNVRAVDLWDTLLESMEQHLDAARSHLPRMSRQRRPALTPEYFRVIDAIEYTRRQDDGSNPSLWPAADVLLLGVSRSGKTPLAIYLGQRGFKVCPPVPGWGGGSGSRGVPTAPRSTRRATAQQPSAELTRLLKLPPPAQVANLPLVPGAPLPPELFQVDPRRVVGLLIDAKLLSLIRKHRLGSMGVNADMQVCAPWRGRNRACGRRAHARTHARARTRAPPPPCQHAWRSTATKT